MEKNCIEEFTTNKNYRSVTFTYNEKNYEINVSLYSNSVLVFICYNGKISNLYELNFDAEEEKEMDDLYYMGENQEENIKDIEIAQCILGERGNEQMNFIANFIISYVKDIILKINSKINKICLSLSLDNNLLENINDNNKVKDFLNNIKINIEKIFNILKK